MVAVTGRAFEAIGWRPTQEPKRGDVAIVVAEQLTGAIAVGSGLFAMPAFNGVLQTRRLPILAAWTWED